MNKIDMVCGLRELIVHRCSVRSVGSTEHRKGMVRSRAGSVS